MEKAASISLTPGYGNTTSGVQQIWQQGLPHNSNNNTANALHTNARLGYGINAPGGLLTPYTEMTYGSLNSYRIGINWQHRGMFDLDLVGEHTNQTNPRQHHLATRAGLVLGGV